MWKTGVGIFGAFAAAVSLFWYGHALGERKARNLPAPVEKVDRAYEWQWAGENWYAQLRIDKDAEGYVISFAKGGLIKKDSATDAITIDRKVMELAVGPKSTIKVTDTGATINLIVDKQNKRTGKIVRETIHGPLRDTLCYTGKVVYSSEHGNFEGDIVLVGSLSASLGPQVTDWFRNPNTPWAAMVR